MEHLMTAYGRLPVSMQSGSGAKLFDDQGREYLDALSGIAVCSLGHANKALADALSDQVSRLMHISNLYREPLQEELGTRLCGIAEMDKAFFCNSGAEANEACIKIARLHGHKKNIAEPMILVTETAFHGRTLATIAATGNTKLQAGFGQVTPGFLVVPYDDIDAVKNMAAQRDDIVAMLIEPIQGEGGIHVPNDNYLADLRAVCDTNDWLMMLDEIQSGMGRTGKWFAHQHSNIKPDVMSVAKALGNGMPIGACLARGDAAELIQPGSHGTTFGGNPLACRAGLTVINEMENDEPCGDLVKHALDAGLLINVAAGNVVRLLPPMILSDAEADQIVDTVSDIVVSFTEKQATKT